MFNHQFIKYKQRVKKRFSVLQNIKANNQIQSEKMLFNKKKSCPTDNIIRQKISY